MSSLWKRSTGPQYRMLKIVSGAVLDAANAHPEKKPDKIFARSVAKRAVGTISAQWVELLAADTTVDLSSGRWRSQSSKACRHRRSLGTSGEKGRPQFTKAAPFAALCKRLGRMIMPARMSGDDEGAKAILAAIKALAPMVRRERGKPHVAHDSATGNHER